MLTSNPLPAEGTEPLGVQLEAPLGEKSEDSPQQWGYISWRGGLGMICVSLAV